jgi:hypothetical protein
MNEYEEALGVRKLQMLMEQAEELPRADSGMKSHFDDLLQQLERAAANERILNKKLMTQKIGTPVIFGDVVQLKHLVSNKFLSVSMTDLALHERENMKVLNLLNGSPYSCISFQPRSTTVQGKAVPSGCETFIRVNERPGEYLRCARKVKKCREW